MKRWRWPAVVLAVVLCCAWLVAAPWLTVRSIRHAVQAEDARALAAHVDFPTLRISLKAQLHDALVRRAGEDMQAHPLGALALALGTGLVNTTVDAMVTPGGLAALMEGRRVWRDARDTFRRPPTDAAGNPVPPSPPLHDARYRYESFSRFTATIQDEHGRPVVFVLHRSRLRWRLAEIRLPLGDAPPVGK